MLPLPKAIEYDKQKALLGKKLYFDTILSKDNTISCASCHNLELGGTDNLPLSFGINGQMGNINTPTVLNAVFNFRQMWDGRAQVQAARLSAPRRQACDEAASRVPQFRSAFAVGLSGCQ